MAAEFPRPRLHVGQSMPDVTDRVREESFPVIGHRQAHGTAQLLERHGDAAGPAVAETVAQRLPHEVHHMVRLFRRKLPDSTCLNRHTAGCPIGCAHGLNHGPQGRIDIAPRNTCDSMPAMKFRTSVMT